MMKSWNIIIYYQYKNKFFSKGIFKSKSFGLLVYKNQLNNYKRNVRHLNSLLPEHEYVRWAIPPNSRGMYPHPASVRIVFSI